MAQQSTSKSGLEVHEDRNWQERFWTIQRIGWVAMALFLLAALFGATGAGGPIANARVATAQAKIDYPRIARWQSAEQVTIHLPPGMTDTVDVEIEKSFADLFAIESVEPQASQVVATERGHRFSFDLSTEAGAKMLAFHVRPSNPTLPRTITARIGDSPPARMTVTVLP